MIPVYIVTGLLGSGKTSLINVELRERKKLGYTEVISFETNRASCNVVDAAHLRIKMTLSFLPQIFLKLGLFVKREAPLSSSFLHVRPASAELPAGAHQ